MRKIFLIVFMMSVSLYSVNAGECNHYQGTCHSELADAYKDCPYNLYR